MPVQPAPLWEPEAVQPARVVWQRQQAPQELPPQAAEQVEEAVPREASPSARAEESSPASVRFARPRVSEQRAAQRRGAACHKNRRTCSRREAPSGTWGNRAVVPQPEPSAQA